MLRLLFSFIMLHLSEINQRLISYSIYQNESSTEWVTFVHGAGGSSSIWFKQIREFQKHFNVLLLDLRGHGQSKPSLKEGFQKKYTFQKKLKLSTC